jgi:hypothetical protein
MKKKLLRSSKKVDHKTMSSKHNNMSKKAISNKPLKPISDNNHISITKNKDGSLTKTFRKEDSLRKILLQAQYTKYPDGYSISQEVKSPNTYRMMKKEYHHSFSKL